MNENTLNPNVVLQNWVSKPKYNNAWTFSKFESGSHNSHYIVNLPREPSLFAKICRHNSVVQDICEREQFTSMMAEILEVKFVSAWISSIPDGVLIEQVQPEYVRDRIVLMDHIHGNTASEAPDLSATILSNQAASIGDLLCFMHWIGDEDRGLNDIMLVNDDFLAIDGGLCGPREESGVFRSAHPHIKSYPPKHILRKCYPKKEPSLVEFVINVVSLDIKQLQDPRIIESINTLHDDSIKQVVDASGLAPYIADIMIDRKKSIAQDFHDWLREAFHQLKQ